MSKSLSIIVLATLFFIAMGSSLSLPFSADNNQHNVETGTEKILQRSARAVNITERRIFRKQMLDAHNYYRALHCAPLLVLDTNLTQAAQKYSNYLIRTNTFEHSGSEEGENLFAFSNTGGIAGYDGKNVFLESI